MRNPITDAEFLLENRASRRLFHDYAENMPIIDYHCHLSPALIAENHHFANLWEAWLAGDHYKWRAMRACAVPERLITGDGEPWEKFQAWAQTVPKTLRNALYHWTHLELKRPFGITNLLLDERSARYVWDTCNEKFTQPAFTTQGILQQMRVDVVCTTDDPIDSLEHHRRLKASGTTRVRMYPAFRPDKAMAAEDPATFVDYINKLGKSANVNIRDYKSLIEALRKRHDFFHANGCRLSDHGLETIYAANYKHSEVDAAFKKVLKKKLLNESELLKFKSAVLFDLALMNHEHGWTQQFHLGALRNNNARQLRTLGPDTGYDSIGDFEIARPLSRLMNRLDNDDRLAKTILYNMNPRDNEVMATMIGNFQDGRIAGKMQYGSAWWFLDQLDGLEKQLNALSNMGVLSQFVGMLTDSRSFLSFPRHEYFRRMLCNILGREIERGLIPNDMKFVGGMVEDICYRNARNYFGLEE